MGIAYDNVITLGPTITDNNNTNDIINQIPFSLTKPVHHVSFLKV